MNERDFLTLAQALAAQTTEAAWRSAVSRAYYAAFHVARRLLEDLGFTVPSDEKAHAYLWLRLSNSGDPQTLRAGSDLRDLRRYRNEADYHLWRFVPQSLAVHRLHIAERIIQWLDAARVQPTRTQITDAMKVYERDVLKNVTWHP
jgi:uncharacterized protein (UPF0332 family)